MTFVCRCGELIGARRRWWLAGDVAVCPDCWSRAQVDWSLGRLQPVTDRIEREASC